MKGKLNPRQRKFAEYYAQSGNTVQSAIKAGYSENYANTNACKLLENDRVTEYLRELSEKATNARIMTAAERKAKLSDVARNENHIEDTSDVIKAIDLLNKMTGEYLNKIEVSGSLKTEMSKLDKILKQLNDE